MKKIIAALWVVSLLFSCLPVGAESVDILYYYVAKDAPPGGDGSIEKPFGTLDQAKNALRRVQNKEDYDDIRILIRGGRYEIEDTVSFTGEDKFPKDSPLTIAAYPGERVIFSGGRSIDMTKAKPVTDKKVLSRIPEEARGSVLSVDLKEQGLTGLGNVYQTYYAVYDVPTTVNLLWNGENCDRARWPNGEYAKVGAVLYAPAAWYRDSGPRRPPEGDPGVIFKVDAPRAAMWKDAPYAWLFGYYGNDWSTYSLAIKDIQSNIVFTKTSPGFGIAKGRPYYIFNLIEELDAPGEWYIDKDKEILYIYPKEEITAETDVCFTILEKNMISLTNSQNINIEGIIFEDSKAAAINMTGCTNCSVAGCVIRNMAASAAGISGGHNNGFRSCDVYNIGATALSIGGGDTETLEPGGNYVVNCHIYNWAVTNRVYNGAISLNGVGQYAGYNKLHYAPHMAISLSGMDCIMEYNEIYDVVRETADSGAIYFGRKLYTPGNIIRYNYFHDIVNTMGGGFTAVGVYFDDMFAGGTCWGNLFVNVDNPVLIGGGSNNHVENNIMLYAPEGSKASIDYDSRGSEARWKETIASMRSALDGYPFDNDSWKKIHPELYRLVSEDADWRMPNHSTVKNNVIIDHIKPFIHENVYKYGEVGENPELSGDVGFVDIKNGDYRLRKDSPIYKLLPEFRDIDPMSSGLYNDAYRKKSDLSLDIKQ